jgi:hypothetical protein
MPVTAPQQPDPAPGADDEPVDAAKAAAFRRLLDRAATKHARDGVRMKTEAKRKHAVAAHLARNGDRIGSMLERAEAHRLDEEGDLVLDPIVHAIGPATIGAGGEIAHGSNRLADIVRMPVDMVTVDASQERLALAEKAGVTTLALDAAATIAARDSLERMLAAQLAAAHAVALELLGQSRQLLRRFETAGHVALNIEATRQMNAASRLMFVYQSGLLTLGKLRSGGQQTVIVRHLQQAAVGAAGQAVVAGSVASPAKKRSGKRGPSGKNGR